LATPEPPRLRAPTPAGRDRAAPVPFAAAGARRQEAIQDSEER